MNRKKPAQKGCAYRVMHGNERIKPLNPKDELYARDESRLLGYAEGIAFPANETELAELFFDLMERKQPVTVQGARTGISGAAVPLGGFVINTGRMNKITGMREAGEGFLLHVQAGCPLSEIQLSVRTKNFPCDGWDDESMAAYQRFKAGSRYFFPPDPTEGTATVGGLFACGAEGSNGYYYGPTPNYVERLTVLTPSAERWEIKRGEYLFNGAVCPLPNGKTLELSGPPRENGTGRGSTQAKTDLIDWFAGSEGTLGVISGLTIRLLPEPAETWGVMCFFPGNLQAVDFALALKRLNFPDVAVTAIDFFGEGVLALMRESQRTVSEFQKIPEISAEGKAAIYVELSADQEEGMAGALTEALSLLERCGGNEALTWAAEGRAEVEKIKLFCHAVQEAIHMKVDQNRQATPEITRMSADFYIPDAALLQVMDGYTQAVEQSGVAGVVLGHISGGHLHFALLPVNRRQISAASELFITLAGSIDGLGGAVSKKYGIGKLKKPLYLRYAAEKDILAERRIKMTLDGENLLNRGNAFSD